MAVQKRRGYVMLIRRGDPEITAAGLRGLLDGATSSDPAKAGPPFPTGEGFWKPAPVQHSEAVRRVAMMRHTPEEWEAMIAQARYDYGQDRPAPKWAGKLLLAWAMLCQGVRRAYRAQDRVLK